MGGSTVLPPALINAMHRAIRLRRMLEIERRRQFATPSRLLRLQALILKIQRRLALALEPDVARPRPVAARVPAGSGSRPR